MSRGAGKVMAGKQVGENRFRVPYRLPSARSSSRVWLALSPGSVRATHHWAVSPARCQALMETTHESRALNETKLLPLRMITGLSVLERHTDPRNTPGHLS